VGKGRALFNSVPLCGTSPTTRLLLRGDKAAFAVEKRLARLGADFG